MKIYVCNVCKKAKPETEYPVTARGRGAGLGSACLAPRSGRLTAVSVMCRPAR